MNPLAGKRVLVTRPRAQAADLCEKLSALEMQPILFPTIEVVPPEDDTALDEAVAQVGRFDWVIFTSVNGVHAFMERLRAAGRETRDFDGVRVAAIGPATAQALAMCAVQPQVIPDEYVAERIPDALGEVQGQRILLPRAKIAREVLAVELRRRGAVVHEVAAYDTRAARPSPQDWAELRRGVDVVTFTSSSTVRELVGLLAGEPDVSLGRARVACIGPITAQTARELGLHVDIVAQVYTMSGLVQAIAEYLKRCAEEVAFESNE
jgi:uroporphyrinogen III methyltransferase/synthase